MSCNYIKFDYIFVLDAQVSYINGNWFTGEAFDHVFDLHGGNKLCNDRHRLTRQICHEYVKKKNTTNFSCCFFFKPPKYSYSINAMDCVN